MSKPLIFPETFCTLENWIHLPQFSLVLTFLRLRLARFCTLFYFYIRVYSMLLCVLDCGQFSSISSCFGWPQAKMSPGYVPKWLRHESFRRKSLSMEHEDDCSLNRFSLCLIDELWRLSRTDPSLIEIFSVSYICIEPSLIIILASEGNVFRWQRWPHVNIVLKNVLAYFLQKAKSRIICRMNISIKIDVNYMNNNIL